MSTDAADSYCRSYAAWNPLLTVQTTVDSEWNTASTT